MDDQDIIEEPVNTGGLDIGGLDLGLTISDDDLIYAAENPDSLFGEASNIAVTVGEPFEFLGVHNTAKFPCRMRVDSARLVRIRHASRFTGGATGRTFGVVSGTFSDVSAQLEIFYNDQWIPIIEVLRDIRNRPLRDDLKWDTAKFANHCQAMRYPFAVANAQIMFQHMGVHEAKTKQLFEALLDSGFRDVTESVRRNASLVQELTTDHGFDLMSFEVGSTDRSMVRNGQGFINFLDSVLASFTRITSMLRMHDTLKALISSAEFTEKDAQTQAAIRAEYTSLHAAITNYRSNWGGVQPGTIVQADNTVVEDGSWYPTQVPIGRFTLELPVMRDVLDPETKEPMIANGRTLREPAMKAIIENGSPALDEHGHPKMEIRTHLYEVDLWRSGNDTDSSNEAADSTVGSALSGVIDTTISPSTLNAAAEAAASISAPTLGGEATANPADPFA